jgi:hypothetical protein
MHLIPEESWKPYIRNNALQMLIQEDPYIRDSAEHTAIGIVKDALQPRYSVPDEFFIDPNAKPQLIWWTISIALYIMYQRIPDKLVPDRIIKNYDDTRADLAALSDGSRETNLPLNTRTDGTTHTKFRYGSDAPRSLD